MIERRVLSADPAARLVEPRRDVGGREVPSRVAELGLDEDVGGRAEELGRDAHAVLERVGVDAVAQIIVQIPKPTCAVVAVGNIHIEFQQGVLWRRQGLVDIVARHIQIQDWILVVKFQICRVRPSDYPPIAQIAYYLHFYNKQHS